MKNKYQIIGDTVAIHINRKIGPALVCLIDLEDLPRAMAIEDSWRYGFNGSRTSTTVYSLKPIGNNAFRKVVLARLLMMTPKNMVCHHRNSNTLDCRKSNMENCTTKENNRHRRARHIPPDVLVG